MNEDIIVYDSLRKIIRKEKNNTSYLGSFITESIFLLNIAKKIDETYISKELGIVLRNFNKREIEFYLPKMSNQIEEAMNIGYDKIQKYEKVYDEKSSEQTNCANFIHKAGIELNIDEFGEVFKYIYSKSIFDNNCLDKKIVFSKREEFQNIKNRAEQLAKNICSQLIVLEIKDYKKIYSLFNKTYFLNGDVERQNRATEKFIYNLVRLMNTMFLKNDSHHDEENNNFQIVALEDFDFEFTKIASFFNGFIHNIYDDRQKTKNLDKINNKFIDEYIYKNKQELNNFLFIISKMGVDDDKIHEFNYREYNLNLISILELLLVNSKEQKDISKKFQKNILICLSYNKVLLDLNLESQIIRDIYGYRSCILHGNYSGYTNSMSNLEKKLEYKPLDFEYSKYNTIDYLISKKLNLYVSEVFEVISKNKLLIDIIKN